MKDGLERVERALVGLHGDLTHADAAMREHDDQFYAQCQTLQDLMGSTREGVREISEQVQRIASMFDEATEFFENVDL